MALCWHCETTEAEAGDVLCSDCKSSSSEDMATTTTASAPPDTPPSLAGEEQILDIYERDVRRAGLVGEEALAKLLLLAVVSRHFDKIVNVAVKGPSAAGKSYTVAQVLRFVPPSAYVDLTSMSELGLVYMEDSLEHRIVVLYEAFALADDSAAAYIVRSLLSEGRLKHQTTIKQKGVLIEKPGPTGLITTTTRVALHEENETRLISVTVDDTKIQTGRVLQQQARQAAGEDTAGLDVEPWHALLAWLETGEHRVVVPFAPALSGLVPPIATRLRRDFPQVLALVQAHALLHRETRGQDDLGRIVAQLHDYAVVREIAAPLIADAAEASVTQTIRETVAAVETLVPRFQGGVTIKALAAELGLDKSSALRRARRAEDRGYLINEEDRPGRPARLRIGDPLSEDAGILPEPDEVAAALSSPFASATVQPSDVSPGQGADLRLHTPPQPPDDRATVGVAGALGVVDPHATTKTGSDLQERGAVAGLHAEGREQTPCPGPMCRCS